MSWIALSILYVFLLMQLQRVAASNELAARIASLSSLVSQRADQHAAHMTGLSALAQCVREPGEKPNAALFLEVAAAIHQFYPRVTSVDLIALQDEADFISSRTSPLDWSSLRQAIIAAALRSNGSLKLIQSPQHADRYLIIKRVPNSAEARFALALEIDARQLLKTDVAFWHRANVELALTLPNGILLNQAGNEGHSHPAWLFEPLSLESVLSSQTQPLTLSAVVYPGARELLPTLPLVLGLLLIALVLIVALTMFRLHMKTRQAESRARLGEHEARIAHASRINSLGELSSGIAHELTQPLTAILSQSQAGIRMAKAQTSPNSDIIEVLNANVAQAKRASSILARLREWTKGSAESRQAVDVNDCIKNVLFLLDAEIQRLSVTMTVDLSAATPLVTGDPVELEQVVFNLVRNALDKTQADSGTGLSLSLVTSVDADQVIIDVKDSGTPLDEALQDRLFEPFVTSRTDGMGLGLALCERIVERMSGEITLFNAEHGVVACVTLPLAARVPHNA